MNITLAIILGLIAAVVSLALGPFTVPGVARLVMKLRRDRLSDYRVAIMRMSGVLLLLIAICLPLAGCKDQSEASAILPTACQSFPGTVIYKVDKRLLWVQTNVDGVSSSVAETMFKQACESAAKNFGRIKINIQTELNFDGRQVLIVGFRRYWVIWPVRNGVDYQGVPVNYQVMNLDGLKAWFTSRLGYFPTPDQIEVVTLKDAQETPKGEPMQLQTLAQLQQVARQQQQAQIQDIIERQKLEQNPP